MTDGRTSTTAEALAELSTFPLVDALFGRRSRRFALGDEIPDGPLTHRSTHEPHPLSELERMLVLSAIGGTTGWHYSITRHARYAPHVSNCSCAAAGRTFPSAAGVHTAELFCTDDSGVYSFPTRDAGALVDPAVEEVTPELVVQRHRERLRRLAPARLHLPPEEPSMEGHNTWCVHVPGSLLVIPVADIAQQLLAILCFFTQNGFSVYDDVHGRAIPGLDEFRGLVDVDEPLPLTFTEQYALTESTAELATACHAGVLMLQALGLGGWMFDGIDRSTMLGASGDPEVPGLGSATTRTNAGRRRTRPAAKACSRRSAHRTTRTWPRRWKRSPSASSAPAARTTATRPAPGPTAPVSAAARRSTTAPSRRASRCRPSTSTTPSASSRARCPPCSS